MSLYVDNVLKDKKKTKKNVVSLNRHLQGFNTTKEFHIQHIAKMEFWMIALISIMSDHLRTSISILVTRHWREII